MGINWPFNKPAVSPEGAFNFRFKAISASSFNPLVGYKIKPRRLAFASRSVIAGLLTVVMLVNYLAFFAQPKPAEATGTPKIEQQINIIDQEYSTQSTTAVPTDQSLGLIRWQASQFSNISSLNFEAVLKTNNASYYAQAQVFTCSDSNCSGGATKLGLLSGCNASTFSTSYSRVRISNLQNCFSYSTDAWLTVRILTQNAAATAYIQAARIVVLQAGSDGGSITASETQVEVGDAQAVSATSYGNITDPKIYCFDGTIATSCTANSPSIWNPGPTIYFEATIKAGASGTTYAQLATTGGSAVSNSAVSTASTSYT